MKYPRLSSVFLATCAVLCAKAIVVLFMVKLGQWALMDVAGLLLGFCIIGPITYMLSVLFMSLGD